MKFFAGFLPVIFGGTPTIIWHGMGDKERPFIKNIDNIKSHQMKIFHDVHHFQGFYRGILGE